MTGEKRTVAIGTVTLREDGILHSLVDFQAEATRESAVEYLEERAALVGDSSPPILIEILSTPFVERSIRRFLMAQVAWAPCRAVVASDPALVNLWRSFLLVDDSGIPTKVFRDVESAVQWIEQQLADG